MSDLLSLLTSSPSLSLPLPLPLALSLALPLAPYPYVSLSLVFLSSVFLHRPTLLGILLAIRLLLFALCSGFRCGVGSVPMRNHPQVKPQECKDMLQAIPEKGSGNPSEDPPGPTTPN